LNATRFLLSNTNVHELTTNYFMNWNGSRYFIYDLIRG